MATVAFSDTLLRSIEHPKSGQVCYWDKSLPSFGLRVGKTAKTFVLNRRNNFITIGRFPLLSLSQARQEAKRQLAEFTLGRVRPQTIGYNEARQLYLEDRARGRRPRTVRDYDRLLSRVSFGQLSDITHDGVAKALKPITAPAMYNHVLVALRVFFNWCVERRYIAHNPTSGFSVHTTQSRSRVLTDEELVRIWRACNQSGEDLASREVAPNGRQEGPRLPASFARICQILVLAGLRRGEAAAIQTSWIHQQPLANSQDTERKFDQPICTLTIPASVTKNRREHTLPLGPLATELLSHSTKQTLLFPARGKTNTPFNGFSKSKTALDKLSGVTDWTLHDLRRTYATNMARLGAPPHIIERLLNHVSGTISGVSAIYNRHSYLEEARVWVDKYEAWFREQIRNETN